MKRGITGTTEHRTRRPYRRRNNGNAGKVQTQEANTQGLVPIVFAPAWLPSVLKSLTAAHK